MIVLLALGCAGVWFYAGFVVGKGRQAHCDGLMDTKGGRCKHCGYPTRWSRGGVVQHPDCRQMEKYD